MRIKMDTASVRFMLTRPAEAKVDRETMQQKVDRSTGALLWQVQVMALDETGGEILNVTVDTEPSVGVGDFLRLDGLVAIPWPMGDRSGVAFRAAGIAAVKGQTAALAA